MCRNCFKKDQDVGDNEHIDLIMKRKKMQKILGKNFETKNKGFMPVIDQLKSFQASSKGEKFFDSVD